MFFILFPITFLTDSVGKAREYLSVLNLTLPDIGEQTIILNNVRPSSDIVVSSCEYFCMIRFKGTPVDAKVFTIQPQQLALSTMNPQDVPFTIDPKVVIVEVYNITFTYITKYLQNPLIIFISYSLFYFIFSYLSRYIIKYPFYHSI